MFTWQQRVKEEKHELDGRLERLHAFIRSEAYGLLSQEQRRLLEKQANLMTQLTAVLGDRLAAP
jgi:hypothetical protein